MTEHGLMPESLALLIFFVFDSRKSLQREFQGEPKGRESLSDLKTQLESLERDLSFLMKFTGIQFTSHSKKTVEKSKQSCALYWSYMERAASIHLQMHVVILIFMLAERQTFLRYNRIFFVDKIIPLNNK